MKKDLYKWQKDCLRAWEANHRRGIAHVVTGAGKTILAIAAIESVRGLFPDLMVRIVVPTIPLARQWETAMRHHMGAEEWRPGLYGAGRRDDPERHVMIYIINSARDSLAGHIRRDLALNRHVLLICDECHHYQSKENRKIFGFRRDPESDLYFALGLSATPLGTANDSVLLNGIGPEFYEYGFDLAVKEGVISPFTVCEVSTSFYAKEGAEYAILTEKIGRILQALYAAHPGLSRMKERDFMRPDTPMA